MLKLGKQILHTLVLLITGMALIGVNVTQSGCIHSDRTYLEVRVLPAENTSPCEVVRRNGNFAKIVVMLLPVMIFIK